MTRKHADSAGGRPAVVSRSDPVAAKAAAIKAEQAHPPAWKTVIKRALVLAVAGVGIYLVLPSLLAVLGSWPRLSELSPAWFTAALTAELASFTCNFALQRLALRTRGWFAVVTAGLAGNAVTNSLPGGDAAGAAVQFSMLTTAGFDTDTAVGALTAFSLLGVGGLLALPVLALPAMLAGAPVSPGLVHTAILGIAAFVLFAIFGAVLLLTDRPLAVIGRTAQSLANRLRRGRPPLTGLDSRLLAERDTIRAVLGKKWWQAVLLITGRLGLDFGCLLAALRATGAHPRPALVLLAYSAAGILALFPITPGGLGIVEASLSGLLILAGVHPSAAVLATLAYRVASYWLPLLAGPPAYLLFRHRYGTPTPEPVNHQAADTGREHHPPNKGVSALQGSQPFGWEISWLGPYDRGVGFNRVTWTPGHDRKPVGALRFRGLARLRQEREARETAAAHALKRSLMSLAALLGSEVKDADGRSVGRLSMSSTGPTVVHPAGTWLRGLAGVFWPVSCRRVRRWLPTVKRAARRCTR